MLIQLWSDEDRTPPWSGELELQRRRNRRRSSSSISTTKPAPIYTRAFDEYADPIQTVALRSGGRYAGISTAQSLEQVIFGELIRTRGIA